MSAPIQTEPGSSTGSGAEGGHVHTCIMHRGTRSACLPAHLNGTAWMQSMYHTQKNSLLHMREKERVTVRDYARVYFRVAHTERSEVESTRSL